MNPWKKERMDSFDGDILGLKSFSLKGLLQDGAGSNAVCVIVMDQGGLPAGKRRQPLSP